MHGSATFHREGWRCRCFQHQVVTVDIGLEVGKPRCL